MAVLDKSLEPKILLSAKEEFLKNGFEKASLREICKNAGVSTGAIYNRYEGKDGLFGELVKETLDLVDKLFDYDESQKEYFTKNQDGTWDISWLAMELDLSHVINFIYDNYDGFKLLISCSSGTIYSNFIHFFVDKGTEFFWNYFNTGYPLKGECELIVDKEELHLMNTTYCSAFFEVVVHDFSREKALSYSKTLSKFFNWQAIVNIK